MLTEGASEILAAVLGGVVVIFALMLWAEFRKPARIVPEDDGYTPRTTPEQRFRNAGDDL